MNIRRFKQGTVIIVIFAMLLNLILINETTMAVNKATLKTKKITVEKGKTKKIVIRNKKSKNKYLYSSSKKKVVSVSKSGVVKGQKIGNAVITVKEKYKVKKKYKTRVVGKVLVKVKKVSS